MVTTRFKARAILSKIAISLAAVCILANAQDTYDTIYNDVGSLPCVRLLNATGSIGCQSMDAASGVLYRADTVEDIKQFANNNELGNKYTVVIPYWLLSSSNIDLLKSSNKLAAILAVVNGTDTAHAAASRPTTITSPDTTCPNCDFGLYANTPNRYQWNPTGSGLLFEQFDFPIYALNTMDNRNIMSYNSVMQAANRNRDKGYRDYPLKSLQFHSFMWGAQDTGACLRKGWCTPVGGASVWSTPSNNISYTDEKPIVIVAAAIDSRSLFHDITLGVESSVAGMVTVLAVAEALSRSTIPLDTMPKHIVYTLFTGEAWGFSGSQRFVQDIMSSPIQCEKAPTSGSGCAFPFYSDLEFQRLNPAKIEAILEVGQIAGMSVAGGEPILYAHVDNIQEAASTMLLNQVVQVGANGSVTAPASTAGIAVLAASSDGVKRGLPPSSSMAFLKSRGNIPTVVLTDYQKQMSALTNHDEDDSWNTPNAVNLIQKAASVISTTAWLQAQGVSDAAAMTPEQTQAIASIQVDAKLIQDLLGCLSLNYSCPLVDRYLNVTASNTPPTRLPHYSGTLYSQSQPFPIFVWSFLANMTSVKSTTSPSQRVTGCSSQSATVQCGPKEYCVGDQCVVSLTRYHDAFGVGIGMNANGQYYIKDASKPVWTESTWDPIGLRMFDVTSPGSQVAELMTGIVLTIVSSCVIWYSRRFLKKTLKED
ncbi:hypothetical protein BGZ95_001960 [Linnemannia exigua]|uniref:Nicastrin n=1 Tax=Linnemannia exigua TaxID=604196 RepID=A0AAD4D6R7_9FUNG|nr:hypothetical protein BGZ95_001960 [Linnemannia exigua]